MPKLQVLPLADDELPEAYPLVRSSAHIGLDRWVAFARALAAIEGGVLGARGEEACFYGVAIFVPLPDLRHDRVLIGQIVAAIELGSAMRVRRALCRGLEGRASALDCAESVTADDSGTDLWMRLQPGRLRFP